MAEKNRTEVQQALNELEEAKRLGQPEQERAARTRLAALGVEAK
jgi:hypothetical protein